MQQKQANVDVHSNTKYHVWQY